MAKTTNLVQFTGDGWHRQELPVAEGQEVFNDIQPVVPLLLSLLRNPGNKLPGPPAEILKYCGEPDLTNQQYR